MAVENLVWTVLGGDQVALYERRHTPVCQACASIKEDAGCTAVRVCAGCALRLRYNARAWRGRFLLYAM